MKTIISKDAPEAIGPYSHSVVSNGFVFVSGQTGVNPASGKLISDDIQEQTKQALKNLNAVLEDSGTDITSVVKTTCFLANISDFAAFNEIYTQYFPKKPARSCFSVKDLPIGAKVEIEVIAEIESK